MEMENQPPVIKTPEVQRPIEETLIESRAYVDTYLESFRQHPPVERPVEPPKDAPLSDTISFWRASRDYNNYILSTHFQNKIESGSLTENDVDIVRLLTIDTVMEPAANDAAESATNREQSLSWSQRWSADSSEWKKSQNEVKDARTELRNVWTARDQIYAKVIKNGEQDKYHDVLNHPIKHPRIYEGMPGYDEIQARERDRMTTSVGLQVDLAQLQLMLRDMDRNLKGQGVRVGPAVPLGPLASAIAKELDR
jgi:hypothetical protein